MIVMCTCQLHWNEIQYMHCYSMPLNSCRLLLDQSITYSNLYTTYIYSHNSINVLSSLPMLQLQLSLSLK